MKEKFQKIISVVTSLVIIGLLIYFGMRWQQNHDNKFVWKGSFYTGTADNRGLKESEEFKSLEDCKSWAQEQADYYEVAEGNWDYSCGTGCAYAENKIVSGKRVQTYECTEIVTGPESSTTIANPASTYCIGQNGQIEIRQDEAGNESGYCIFSDGSECEEWQFFRDECQPGINY